MSHFKLSGESPKKSNLQDVCTGPMVINYGLENRLEKIASGLVLGSVTGVVPF